ncbi:MAG: type II toxin-antitoxin system VapC family toxin [Chloroflexota bacterium]
MSADAVYVESSAFVKLFLPEPESLRLAGYLASYPRKVSAMLLRTEALRAAVRATLSPARVRLVRALLETISLIPTHVALSDDAGTLQPPELRSLDAIHLATARSVADHLAAFVTYDARLAAAAAWHGLPVVSP